MVSIILPVYNREKYIKECLDSVFSQTYQNFEIVLVDDGSTDKTLGICEEIAKTEPRLRIFKGEHKGVSEARNKALENAKGKYIFFLDSDDIINPKLLEALVSGLEKSDAAIAATFAVGVSEKNWDMLKKTVSKANSEPELTYQTHNETLNIVFNTNSPLSMIGGVMMRRDLVGNTEFKPDLFIGEDFYFIYENLIKGANTLFLRQKWYYTRWHSDNISDNYTFAGFWTRFYRRELVWESEESFGRTEYADTQKREVFRIYLKCIYNSGSKTENKKIQEVMKKYRKILLPAFPFIGKIIYYSFVYMPFTYFALHPLFAFIKSAKRKSKKK